jgi:GNAT superfamily N-acetyltransferase
MKIVGKPKTTPAMESSRTVDLEFKPLTRERWPDLVSLFANNSVKDCWCLWWRITGNDFTTTRGPGKRREMKKIVDEGRIPGILAYEGGKPVGWCSIAPREEYGRLQRSRTLGPLDKQPAWSIVCFFVDPAYRKLGVSEALLPAAVIHATEAGARIIEAYPRDPGSQKLADTDVFMGPMSIFMKGLGFKEVERRAPGRPILRLELEIPGVNAPS